MRKFNLRIIAFLLMLNFSQKLGLELWIHHCLHQASIATNLKGSTEPQINIKCDCLDEVTMPLTISSSDENFLSRKNYILFLEHNYTFLSSPLNLFSSFRGPPFYLHV